MARTLARLERDVRRLERELNARRLANPRREKRDVEDRLRALEHSAREQLNGTKSDEVRRVLDRATQLTRRVESIAAVPAPASPQPFLRRPPSLELSRALKPPRALPTRRFGPKSAYYYQSSLDSK